MARIAPAGADSPRSFDYDGKRLLTAVADSICPRHATSFSSTRHFHSLSARPVPVKPRSRSVLLRNSPILICQTKAEEFPCGMIRYSAKDVPWVNSVATRVCG